MMDATKRAHDAYPFIHNATDLAAVISGVQAEALAHAASLALDVSRGAYAETHPAAGDALTVLAKTLNELAAATRLPEPE